MSKKDVRVAFFPDSFLEIDGVANTARQFAVFARRRGMPFLLVYGGSQDSISHEGDFTSVQCRRGRVGFALDRNHDFDLLFLRHYARVCDRLKQFAPDLIHITGPSDVGILGALLAHRLSIPLVASWHTNLHQYAEQRAVSSLSFLPSALTAKLGPVIRESTLAALGWFYGQPRILFAPNRELIDLLERISGKPCHPMGRGVDTALFDPCKRVCTDQVFTIGFVGRLSPEKNIAVLPEIERELLAAGERNFRFLIVGQGAWEPWLRTHMRHAEFTGVLRGELLAEAYASMDVFTFPSTTDTFGNVVLEALASGVPAITSAQGGPHFIVTEGETGFVAHSPAEFAQRIQSLRNDPQRLRHMRDAARRQALKSSWAVIFSGVCSAYDALLVELAERRRQVLLGPACANGPAGA